MTDIELLKDWLKQQPHLPDSWDEQWLSTCLRHCSFSLEKSKKKIDSYFTIKNAAFEFFIDRDVAKIKQISKFVNVSVIPHLMMPHSYKVTIISITKNLDEGLEIIDYCKTILMLLDARCASGEDESLGDVFVSDYSVSFCAYLLKKLTLSQLKMFATCIQDAFPNKMKGFHFLNVSPVLQTLLNVVKPILKEKIRNRIYLHPNLESLHKHVPKANLPEEYGGTAGTIKNLTEETWSFLEKYQEWFSKTENVRIDESRRLGPAKNYEEIFGVDGSFRQLKID